MSMLNLAQHIIGVANQNKIGVTQLHLQKTLYFTLLEGFKNSRITREELESIYDEPFEAWPYGPVVRSVYDCYKKFNSSNITVEGETSDNYKNLNDIISQYLDKRTSLLVKESHSHPFWKKSYEDGKIKRFDNPKYSIDDLLEVVEYGLGVN